MSAAFIKANLKAKEVLASLKSGVLLKGTVRSHSTYGSTGIACIAIQLPAVGERRILVKDEQHLQPGRKVVIQCVPNPLKPECYIFQLASAPYPCADGKRGAAPRSG
jgi:hypothetical protein